MSRELILHDLYLLIGGSLPSSSYAMKGGYVLRSLLDEVAETRDIRYTEDIDVSVRGIEYFSSIVDAVLPYIQRLVANDTIYSYKIQEPDIETGRSGYIKLYRKATANTRAYVYCGIDVDTRVLDYGIITLNDGTSSYSVERMLADKFMALYFGDVKRILHRSKDIVDIYLIVKYLKASNTSVSISSITRSIREQLESQGITELGLCSSLENVYMNNLQLLLKEMDSVKNFKRSNFNDDNIVVLNYVIQFINYVRSMLNV